MTWWRREDEWAKLARDVLLRVSRTERDLEQGLGRVLASSDAITRALTRQGVALETILTAITGDHALMARRIEILHDEVLRLSGVRATAVDHEAADTVRAQHNITDKKLEEIHVLVNDERSAMIQRMEDLHDEVRRLHAQILALSRVREEAAGHERGVAEQKQADRTAFKPPEP